ACRAHVFWWSIGGSIACVTRLRRKCNDGVPRTEGRGPRTDRGADARRRPRIDDRGPDLEPRTSVLEHATSDLGPRTSDLDSAASSDRSLASFQDLSPLRPPQAVRDVEERAAVAQPHQEPQARRDVHGAERRHADRSEGTDARRDWTERIRQEHIVEADRGNYQAVERNGAGGRTDLRVDATGSRV